MPYIIQDKGNANLVVLHRIESRAYIDRLNGLINVMQRQAKQLGDWREKTVNLLLMPLVDEEQTDLKGDEYEISTKQQDEVYVYVDALRALIADRHDIITGQQNELIKHEMNVALKQAKEGQGHSPELLIELLNIRNMLLPENGSGSARSLITEIREFKTGLRSAAEKGNSRAAAELLIVNGALEKLHRMSTEQTKVRQFRSVSHCLVLDLDTGHVPRVSAPTSCSIYTP